MGARIVLLGTTCLLCSLMLGLGAAEESWRRIEAPLSIRFPKDHGSHPEFASEWWYVTGVGHDRELQRFAWQLTIFRRGIDPKPPQVGASSLHARQIFTAHLAVHSIEARRMSYAERIRREAASLAGASTDALDAWIEDWKIESNADGTIDLSADDIEARIALSLRLTPTKAPVLHGDGGLSAKGDAPGNASAYYSLTRLATNGSLEFDGKRHSIVGESWFDHEWGTTQLGEGVVGWDWFALRLDDGRELMICQLRRADGSSIPQSLATLVDSVGSVQHLSIDDFSVEITDRWKSPRSGASYPSHWKVRVPRHAIEVEVTPMISDAELDTSRSTEVTYWEGSVSVTGSQRGQGFVELTGYAHSMSGRL